MLLNINQENPEMRKIAKVIDCLKKGGIIIYPTDTIYGLGCDIQNPKAVERICRIKGIKSAKANLSFICNDLSHLSDYAAQLDNQTFKLLRRTLPGPYTYILKASSAVPKLFKSNKKTVGLRVPDNIICQTLIRELGRPILSSSLKAEDGFTEYLTDPYDIHEKYGKLVDIVIDGGMGKNTPSTVIDCTSGQPEVIREGLGPVDDL